MILLNNDTQVFPDFVEALYRGIAERPRAFSAGAMMIQAHDHRKLIQPGIITALLDGLFPGERKKAGKFEDPKPVFAVCAGAAIYRMELLREIGLFDEEHFAYLEDLDIGYRPESPDMKTGICPRPGFITWAAGPAVPL